MSIKGMLRAGRVGLLCLVVQGCGGGGGGDSSPMTTVSGTVAVGAAVAGATVQLKCAVGSAQGTSDTNGRYSASAPLLKGPCMLRASGGSSRMSVPVEQFSVVESVSAGGNQTANLTPLTQLLVSRLLGKDPAQAFSGCCASGEDAGRITAANLVAARALVYEQLSTKLGMSDDTLRSQDWIGGAFSLGDPIDRRLDLLGTQMSTANLTLAQASEQIRTGDGLRVSAPLPPAGCLAGLIAGYKGDFSDQLLAVPQPAAASPNGGGDGSSGAAGGGSGAGAGSGEGQLFNVEMQVEQADGRTWTIFTADGLGTYVPCGYGGPVLFTVRARPGALSSYFDEALRRTVPLPDDYESHAMIESVARSVGITPFTEAGYQYARQLAPLATGGIAPKAVSQSWQDPARVALANKAVSDALTDQLPGIYRTISANGTRNQPVDITRLPKVLGQADAVPNGALPDSNNGIYGAVLAGFAKSGKAYLNTASATPALDIRRQFVADMTDGVLDMKSAGSALVAAANRLAYTPDALWRQLTVGTAQTANEQGAGQLASRRVPLQHTLSNQGGVGYTTLFSSGEASFSTNASAISTGIPLALPAGVRFVDMTETALDGQVHLLDSRGCIWTNGRVSVDVYGIGFAPVPPTAEQCDPVQRSAVTRITLAGDGWLIARTAGGNVIQSSKADWSARTEFNVNATSVAAVSDSSVAYAVIAGGTVASWCLPSILLSCEYALLGNGDTGVSNEKVPPKYATPTPVPGLQDIKEIFAGERGGFALDRNGKLFVMVPTPRAVQNLPAICYASWPSYAVACDGRLFRTTNRGQSWTTVAGVGAIWKVFKGLTGDLYAFGIDARVWLVSSAGIATLVQ